MIFQKIHLSISIFYKNVSPNFYNIKLFYLKNYQHYVGSIYKILINLNNFTNSSINIL